MILIIYVAGVQILICTTWLYKEIVVYLSFSFAFWDGISNLSSMFLNYFSEVSVLCFALSKTVNLLHIYSLQFFLSSACTLSHHFPS